MLEMDRGVGAGQRAEASLPKNELRPRRGRILEIRPENVAGAGPEVEIEHGKRRDHSGLESRACSALQFERTWRRKELVQ
jgi:hypothetical protein